MANAQNNPWESDYRLPQSTQPLHYDLYMYPDLVSHGFTGKVSILINSTEVREYFILHSKGLTIENSSLFLQDENEQWQNLALNNTLYYTPNEVFVIIPEKAAEPGLYKFSCDFTGSLEANGLVSFYVSDYVDEKNQTRKLATTKFQPTFARQAFPCFDEPSFRSTFTVTVVRPSTGGYIALSNMPVLSETVDQPSSGLTEVSFQKSVPMVSYLVCFIVCDFTYLKQAVLPSGLDFRVYAPDDRVDRTSYANEVGRTVLQYFEKLFKIPFPLPKSDMAAIPDYISGATEHWGIITYRETSILYNKLTSSETNKQRVASVIAHELAHQWFGNLVTLEWWDDLWLNEGFASYIEYKGVNHMHPRWDMMTQFVPDTLQSVLIVDSKLSSHAIVQQVDSPDQITAMFDAISYDKGSSILRMLEGFLGEDVFIAGINSFLKKYAYQNAVTNQLWQELTNAWVDSGVNEDVGLIMNTWTEQMGYPVLTVTREGTHRLLVSQSRFLQDPQATSDPSESTHGYQWHVPVTYVSSHSKPKTVWLWKAVQTVIIDLPSESTWYKLNYGQMGYYRVNYDNVTWNDMSQLLSEQKLEPRDRSNLYDDSLALADADMLPYSQALDILTNLISEKHLVPWATANNRFPRLIRLLETTTSYTDFKKYIAGLTNPIYLTLGWQDKGDHLQQLLRVKIVYLSCIAGLQPCLEESARLLQQFAADASAPLPLSTKRQVLRQGMVLGCNLDVWNELWSRAIATQDATQKDNLLYGLANSQNTTTLARYIELSKDPVNVRSQDFMHVLEYISSNEAGTDLVWDWVRTNWEWLVDRYTINDRYLGKLIPNISKYFATKEKLLEMEEFFAKYPEAGAGEQSRRQALETVKTNIRWVEKNSDQIREWLNGRNP